MSREIFDPTRIHTSAAKGIGSFHQDTLGQVKKAVSTEPVVVVGMSVNPFVKKVRAALDEAGVAHKYLEYGSYLSGWKERLAIKMWSGWPTFPQVFVRGQLVGGCEDTKALLQSGELKTLLK